jgi:hypothetical protein
MPPSSAFRRADSQSDIGAFRYHSGFPYLGTGLVQHHVISAIGLSKYRISSWQILETIGQLDAGSKSQSIGLSDIRLTKNYWLLSSAKGTPATAGMPAIEGSPTIVLPSAGTPTAEEMREKVWTRVRPHFRFRSEIWNWSENFVSLGSENKAWFHTIHFDAKHQKSEAKIKWKNLSETKIIRKKVKIAKKVKK